MKLPNPDLELPTPSHEEVQLSQQLCDVIIEKISHHGGKLSFTQFMEMALYTPSLGYYAAERPIFGAQGDFVTAPELTPIFSRCLANQVHDVLSKLDGGGDILEVGAGSGTMATDILLELEKLNGLPNRYIISEVSQTLQQRQHARIKTYAPHLLDRVSWIDALPASFIGVILGNEILDALPTHRVRFNHNKPHEELFVSHENNQLMWVSGAPENDTLKDELNRIYREFGSSMPENYETEINLTSRKWVKKISKTLTQGVVLLIDYGFSEQEFYRPERSEGSLMCHYKHCAHSDPLTHVGLQDITAHVNFTDIAEVAFHNDMTISGFTTQTYFLLGCGLESFLNEIDINDTKQFIAETQPVKVLILPEEMGDLFKVIGLSKNVDHDLLGFRVKNLLERL